MRRNCWLKSNTCIEPLVSQWYAWTHLLAPSTAGSHLSKYYLKILKSYLTHPELHMQASQDPRLRGGPYVNFSENKTREIESLYNRTLVQSKDLFELSKAMDELSIFLANSAQGLSLENFYQQIPAPLSGCVELVYDMHHNASFRLIEPLIYLQYYSTANQSVLLSLHNQAQRSFILSTPRLPREQDLLLDLPFSSEAINLLSRYRREPCSLDEIQEVLSVPRSEQAKLATFFTDKEPVSHHTPCQEHELRIRYFGHACILIETQHTSILIDPLICYANSSKLDSFTHADLPENIDYVLITHGHQDHIDIETLIQIRHQIKTIIVPDNNNGFLPDPSLKLMLENIGFEEVITLRELDQIKFIDGCIIGVPFLGEHGDLNIHTKLAYYIRIKDRTMLFAVDSNNIDISLYQALTKSLGSIDTLFIGMECAGAPFSWTYGALFPQAIKREHDQSRRLNGSDAEKAWQITQTFHAKEVQIYAMGQEPWLSHIMGLEYTPDSFQLTESNKYIQKCLGSGIKAEMPYGKKEWRYQV